MFLYHKWMNFCLNWKKWTAISVYFEKSLHQNKKNDFTYITYWMYWIHVIHIVYFMYWNTNKTEK